MFKILKAHARAPESTPLLNGKIISELTFLNLFSTLDINELSQSSNVVLNCYKLKLYTDFFSTRLKLKSNIIVVFGSTLLTSKYPLFFK